MLVQDDSEMNEESGHIEVVHQSGYRRNVSRWLWILFLVALTLPGLADDKGTQVYSESFRKGATRITEQTFNVTLTAERPTQEFKILDSTGKQRYVLRFVPEISRGDTKVIGWFVRLADLHHRIYDTVLPTSPDVSRDVTQAWWFDGRPYAKIPLNAARVFKVERFYCVLQVKDSKRVRVGVPYFQQMEVAVQFTNTKP